MTKDIEYEKFTQEIYQALLIEDGLTVLVQHNIKVKGRAATHQIDVYWEYTFAGIRNKVAIECKNYNRDISIGKIRDFYGVLSDIGNINGIMVTKKGYQKGAKEFAESYGINLIVLREPVDEDWKGRIRILKTNVEAIEFNITNCFIQLDLDWFKEKFPEEDINNFKLSLSGRDDEKWIFDEDGNKLKNFLQLKDDLPFDNNNGESQQKYFYMFDKGYIMTGKFGSIKIKGIELTYNITIDKYQYIYDSKEATKAIVKNIQSGDLKFIKKI